MPHIRIAESTAAFNYFSEVSLMSYRVCDVHPLCSLRLPELAIDQQLDGGLRVNTILTSSASSPTLASVKKSCLHTASFHVKNVQVRRWQAPAVRQRILLQDSEH